jgi:hypothetical protein
VLLSRLDIFLRIYSVTTPTQRRTMARFHASLACCFALLGAMSASQLPAQSLQRPLPHPVVPSREFRQAVQNGTRTNTGEPGSRYWQQWAEYSISTRLTPEERMVEGTVRIAYHNRSPDPLGYIALNLLQNLHAEGVMRSGFAVVTGGVDLSRVAVADRELEPRPKPGEAGYTVNGTVLRVFPPEPVQPGETINLSIDWHFTVPQAGASGRMGWSEDNMFHIAYWYPQVAVYDDVNGWHTDQFLGGAEFYSGFATYDLSIAAPEGWVVMATGQLLNPEEVLASEILQRYRAAHDSDEVVHVLTAEDFGPGRATGIAPSGFLVWRFHADSVRDVAFSATSESLWDAARTPVGDRDGDGNTDYALINTFWRAAASKWSNAWRYAQHSIDFMSRWTGLPYPWPHMTSVEGGSIIGGGMEFPMMTLIGDYNTRSDSALYYVTAHELGHMWVPMIVSTDERRHAWMDEGTTTFNENQARKEFFPGFNHDHPDRDGYLAVARLELEGEMMRWSDYHYPGPAYSTASYSKPATVLVALRGLLGEAAFVRGFREYIDTWAYKHPQPWDFFNTFDRTSGQNLGWFWRSWYYETWILDHAVDNVREGSDGTTIVIEDRGQVPMPARITITLADGQTMTREVPVGTWLAGKIRSEVSLPAGAEVVRVEIDAEHLFPDIDRSNNVWQRRSSHDW